MSKLGLVLDFFKHHVLQSGKLVGTLTSDVLNSVCLVEDCCLHPVSEKEDGALLLLEGEKIDKFLDKPTITFVVSKFEFHYVSSKKGQSIASSYDTGIIETDIHVNSVNNSNICIDFEKTLFQTKIDVK